MVTADEIRQWAMTVDWQAIAMQQREREERRRTMAHTTYVLVCGRCRSERVVLVFARMTDGQDEQAFFRCLDCGYEGTHAQAGNGATWDTVLRQAKAEERSEDDDGTTKRA